MKNKYYDAEMIYRMQDIPFTMGTDRLRRLIAEVFTKIPTDVVDQIVDDCLYLMVEPEGGAVFYPNRVLKNKHICIFPHTLFDASEQSKVFTILHETAHCYLKHKSPLEFVNPTDRDSYWDQYSKQEKEADDLVDKWSEEWEASQKE